MSLAETIAGSVKTKATCIPLKYTEMQHFVVLTSLLVNMNFEPNGS